MSASVTPSPSVNFKIFMVLSVGSGSDSSASLRQLCSRISKIYYRMCSWSWDFSYWKKRLVFIFTKFNSSYNMLGLGANDIQCRTIRGEKIRGYFTYYVPVK
jgi:hypothetical protein